MKIAVIVEKFPVISETFITNQIAGLIRCGYVVDIYAELPGDFSRVHPDVDELQLLKNAYFQPALPANYLVRFTKALKLLIRNFFKNPKAIFRSLNVFRYGKQALSLRLFYLVMTYLQNRSKNCQWEYDIIHCQFGMLGLQGILLRDMGVVRGNIITSLRGFDISWYVQEYGDDVYRELFKKGNFFLANCEFFRQKAIKIGCSPEKIIVHHSGIDCDRFLFQVRQMPVDNIIKIVTIGRLIEKKGIEYAIRAVAQVVENYPKIEYSIIGDGWLKQELQQLIISLHLENKIKLLGWKTQPEIVKILEQSHIFIAPSVTAKDGNQDAPVNTLKEAMAMGLPVIATFHGGIPELVQDGVSGFLVPERDGNAIAVQIQYLIDHPEIWSDMGKAGRDYVQTHFDTNKLNDELVEIYQRIGNGKKS